MDDGNEPNHNGIGCFGIIVIVFILYYVTVRWGWNIPFFSNLFKYEGQTAEEWYYDYADAENRYERLKSCIEDYITVDEAIINCE